MKLLQTRILTTCWFLWLCNSAFAITPVLCDGTASNPCIVQDTNLNPSEIKHWRTSAMIYETYKGNVYGLNQLWLSGSGAPSANGFKSIATNIKTAARGNYYKMIDLDLRQEDHAYLNDDAITLTTEHDWINRGKSYQQSIQHEQTWISSLTTQSIIDNVLTPALFKTGNYSQGYRVKINSITDEKHIAEDAGFDYVRLTVSDHMSPRKNDVDRFVTSVRNLPNRSWVHIHCRGGDGRTTTFLAMFDMLKNADNVSFDDIIKRQAAVDPYYDLSELDRNDPTLSKFYKERYDFLNHFYQFAVAYIGGFQGNWSDWLEQNPSYHA